MNEVDFTPEISQYFEPDPRLEEIQERELLKKLEDRAFLDEIVNSNSWRIFREAWRRMYKDADEVLTKCKPDDISTIAFAQATKRFYSDVLATTIQAIKQDGDAALNEMKRKGKLNKIATIKKRKKR